MNSATILPARLLVVILFGLFLGVMAYSGMLPLREAILYSSDQIRIVGGLLGSAIIEHAGAVAAVCVALIAARFLSAPPSVHRS